ncbi:MAG: hypothetical protein ACTHU0_22535 [Kofleriaceae bacterium]
MARSDRALRRVRRAYEAAHLAAAARAVAIAGALCAIAVGLHRTSSAMWLVAGALAASLAAFAWRGGAWRRGAFAGVLAGLPPLIVPSLVLAMSSGGHCTSCEPSTMLPCVLACFGTSSLVGIAVGYRASSDVAPRRFALAAIATAAFTGLLGCGTTGLGGALGVGVGIVAGGVTGWWVAARAAHA